VLFVCIGIACAVAPVLAFYAAHGNLGNLIEAVFVQAYRYSRRPITSLLELILPGSFGTALEGTGVGALLLIALLFGLVAAGFLLRAIRTRGLDVRNALAAALVAFLVPAVLQGYMPPLLVRFLQSAICFYLLIAFVLGELGERARRPASLFAGLTLALYVGFVIGGPQKVVPSDAYTGSLRSLRYSAPVRVFGDEFLTDEITAGEVRLIRAFIEERAPADAPIFTAPLLATYYLLLERRNPTAFLGDFWFTDLAMSRERKRAEMQRLLASETRYAVVDLEWWLMRRGPSRPILNTILSAFVPVRLYESLAILERDTSPGRLRMHEIARRILKHRTKPADASVLRKIVRKWPDEPVPREMLGELFFEQQKFEAAVASLEAALRLDPANPRLQARLEEVRAHLLR
jgi:hypothetical protein